MNGKETLIKAIQNGTLKIERPEKAVENLRKENTPEIKTLFQEFYKRMEAFRND